MSREGSRTVFVCLKSERLERRRTIRLDRKHLEARARRFLKIYLNADETRKPQFYRVVEEASKQCRPIGSGLPPSGIRRQSNRRSHVQCSDENCLGAGCSEET